MLALEALSLKIEDAVDVCGCRGHFFDLFSRNTFTGLYVTSDKFVWDECLKFEFIKIPVFTFENVSAELI